MYKARERIHRAVADARLLANPASIDVDQYITSMSMLRKQFLLTTVFAHLRKPVKNIEYRSVVKISELICCFSIEGGFASNRASAMAR